MDLSNAITKLMKGYDDLIRYSSKYPKIGFYIEAYESDNLSHFLFVFLTPTDKKTRGKLSDLKKMIERSSHKHRVILPREFQFIRRYLNRIFPSIETSSDRAIETLRLLIAGLRLDFVPYNNIKYELDTTNPGNVNIGIFSGNVDRQFYLYVNILDTKEAGLYLAHEKQLEYLIEKIKNGMDLLKVKNLPPLRTGKTLSQIHKNNPNDNANQLIRKFKQKIKQKKEKEEELTFETVIEKFGPPSPSSHTFTDDSDDSIKNGSAPLSPFALNPQKAQSIQTLTDDEFQGTLTQEEEDTKRIIPSSPFYTDKQTEQLEKLNKKIEELETKLIDLEETNKSLVETIDVLKSEVEQKNLLLQTKEKEIVNLNLLFSQKQSESSELENKYAQLLKELHEKEDKIRELEAQLEEKESMIEDLNEEILFLKEQSQKKEEQYAIQSQAIDSEVREYEEIMEELVEIANERDKLLEELKEIKKNPRFLFPSHNINTLSLEEIFEILEENELLSRLLKK